MFIALGIMICGIVAGRALRDFLSPRLVHLCIMSAIFLLLFLLGVSIGANENLLTNLPRLGLQALLLIFCALAGSILAVRLVSPLIHGHSGKTISPKK